MGITNHTWPISHNITPLVINGPGGGHTHTHTYRRVNKNDFKKPGMRGQRPCTPGLKKCNTQQLLTKLFDIKLRPRSSEYNVDNIVAKRFIVYQYLF